MGLFSSSPEKLVTRALRDELRARGLDHLYTTELRDKIGKRLLSQARRNDRVDPATMCYVVLPEEIQPMVRRVVDQQVATVTPPAPPRFAANERADRWRAGYDDALNERSPDPTMMGEEPYHRGYSDGVAKRAKR